MFGSCVKFPFGFSPTAMQGLAHPDGELATSRATANLNIPMGLSAYSSQKLEDVAAAGSGNPYVMQISLLKNREAMVKLVQRTEGILPDGLYVSAKEHMTDQIQLLVSEHY